MTLKWEFLGKQQLWEGETPGKGYAYAPLVWRTPVPNGWLLMVVNSKSNDPQPTLSFYPDPDHQWNIATDPQAATLLRAASGPGFTDPSALLRASDSPPELEP